MNLRSPGPFTEQSASRSIVPIKGDALYWEYFHVLTALFWCLSGLVAFTTLAPLTASAKWWIRGWDFPRIHIAVVAFLTLALGAIIAEEAPVWALAALGGAVIYQLVRVFPYTPLARAEVDLSPVSADRSITAISSNVLKENTDHQRLRALINRERPDILFLMEIDQTWADALRDQLAEYPTVIEHPLSNHYGLIFATRLKVNSKRVVFLSDDETPAVLADLQGPTGRFNFAGLHPRPPVPGIDTEERDEQIRRMAELADAAHNPVVVMGDFNDVAWSKTSERFKDYGGLKDPRVGRGVIPSFDARSWFMRLPIDQLYISDGIQLASFERLEPIGSDHFPMKAVFSVRDTAD